MTHDFRIAEPKDLAPLPDPGSHSKTSPSSCYLGASLSLVTWVAQFGSNCDAQHLSYCVTLSYNRLAIQSCQTQLRPTLISFRLTLRKIHSV